MINRINIKLTIMSESRRAIGLLLLIFLCNTLAACGRENITIIDDQTRFSEQINSVETLSTDTENVAQEESAYEADNIENIVVHICGAVNDEGVYELESGSRIIDVVKLAGGLTENACDRAVNLSERIEDSQRIYIPTKEEVESGNYITDYNNASTGDDGKVNINTADAAKLTSLNGIGMTRAEAIIAYRESHGAFAEIDDIKNVSGIGDSSFEKIRESIKVR